MAATVQLGHQAQPRRGRSVCTRDSNVAPADLALASPAGGVCVIRSSRDAVQGEPNTEEALTSTRPASTRPLSTLSTRNSTSSTFSTSASHLTAAIPRHSTTRLRAMPSSSSSAMPRNSASIRKTAPRVRDPVDPAKTRALWDVSHRVYRHTRSAARHNLGRLPGRPVANGTEVLGQVRRTYLLRRSLHPITTLHSTS